MASAVGHPRVAVRTAIAVVVVAVVVAVLAMIAIVVPALRAALFTARRIAHHWIGDAAG